MSRPLTSDELRAEREAYRDRQAKREAERDARAQARRERLGLDASGKPKRRKAHPFQRDFVVGRPKRGELGDVDYRPSNDFDVSRRGP